MQNERPSTQDSKIIALDVSSHSLQAMIHDSLSKSLHLPEQLFISHLKTELGAFQGEMCM